jgi:UDP-N-acetylglucosamine transferase subunit ALG13
VILVTVGTHEDPFDRLVVAAEALARRVDEPVVVQGGPSLVPTPSCERHATLTPTELAAQIRAARLVVLHGGPSTLAEVLDAGVPAVVVPRDPTRGEHVDDHQIRWASSLADRITVVVDPADLPDVVVGGRWRLPDPSLRRSAVRTAEFCAGLDAVLDDVLRRQPEQGARWCDMLARTSSSAPRSGWRRARPRTP